MKHLLIIFAAALIIALPFIFRRSESLATDSHSALELVIVTPHNEAIRQSFAEGFNRWHFAKFGTEVRIDWRAIGGTTEIMRYLEAEYTASARQYCEKNKIEWSPSAASAMLARSEPDDQRSAMYWQLLRAIDDPDRIGCGIDLFFGGGVYDHDKAARQGLTVPAWSQHDVPVGIFEDARGRELIPETLNGEQWRTSHYYGTALSTFGICCNLDRLRDLNITEPPSSWSDLADPRYMGQIGLTDPTKSGSVAKTFEMIIHSCCAQTVSEAGFSREQIIDFEVLIKASGLKPGVMPPGVPDAYQQAVGRGWIKGINLVRVLGAQSRYFTVSAGKVPVDVSLGLIAAGVCIDFYGRYQSEIATLPNGRSVMLYTTPVGGSSVTADPVSLLRGARQRELALRFISFVLGEDGQKLWNYRMGEPGGPSRFSLRRLPIRRDFYPSDDPQLNAAFERHRPHLADQLWQADVDAYQLADAFLYQPRWTGRHFGIQRDLIKAMCLDSGEELRVAWRAIVENGGALANPAAMQAFEALPSAPYPLSWLDAVTTCADVDRLELLREWSSFFRRQYRLARTLAERKD